MLDELKKIKILELDEEILRLEESKKQTKKYNYFEKTLFKKKEYQNYLVELKQRNSEIDSQIEILKNKRLMFERATVIQHLELDLSAAIDLLNKHGIDAVITEEEIKQKVWMQTKPDVDTLEGIILVHKTNYMPSNNSIKSVKEAESYYENNVEIAGHNIPIKIQRSRDTVHFAANGEVASHLEGNWEESKYAVLIPFNNIPRDKISRACANDTYTNGGVQLTNEGWIIVPKGEGAEARKNNPLVNVIEYDGPNVTGFADKLIGLLGYRYKQINYSSGWVEGNEIFDNLMMKNGFEGGRHYGSDEYLNEKFLPTIQTVIQIMRYVENNIELMSNPEFVNGLTDYFKNSLVIGKENLSKFYNYMEFESYTLPEYIKDIKIDNYMQIQYLSSKISEELINVLVERYQALKNLNEEKSI